MKVVGRDVSVYTLELYGTDGNPGAGAAQSLLGRWESLELEWGKDWSDVTSSDALEPEERKILDRFRGSCKNWIDGDGSLAVEAAQSADFVMLVYTEIVSGKTAIIRAGIDKARMEFTKENAKDNLDFSSKGKLLGLPSFSYA